MADQAFLTYGITATGSTTARSMPDRLNYNVKNVKEWGATGNGVTDDHAAIQAAVDAVWFSTFNKRGTIYFPPGTYYVSAPIEFGGEATPQELTIVFRGVGNASKIIGSFNGGVISCYHPPASGVAGCPILIEDLWLDQSGVGEDDAATVPGSHCIYFNGPSCAMVRNVKCTTTKYGIGIDNCQGCSVFNCYVAATGSAAYRFGIHLAGNGTITSCYVTGFTVGIRVSQIGGCVTNCVVTDNDIGYEGGPYGIDPLAVNQFLTEYAVMSNRFENNGTGIYPRGAGAGLIAGNTVIGSGSASYGIRSSLEGPNRTLLAGNTCSGAFSVAAITTPSASTGAIQFFLGMTATNSGAGVAWGEEQSNNAYSNTYINSNSTGVAIRHVYAGLPDGTNGNRCLGASYWITDGNNATWGGVVNAGFGGNHVKVRWNGSDWTVVGK